MQQVKTKTKAGILSELETTEFAYEIDLACKTTSFEKLELLFSKLGLNNHAGTTEFLLKGKYLFNLFNNVEKGFEIVAFDSFKSKCSFCYIGNTVEVYKIDYKKNKGGGVLARRVIYTNSFGLNLMIPNGRLFEFSWCHMFLNKTEMRELKY